MIDSKAVARTRTGRSPAGFQVSSATRRKGTSRDELQVGIFFEYSIGRADSSLVYLVTLVSPRCVAAVEKTAMNSARTVKLRKLIEICLRVSLRPPKAKSIRSLP